MEKWKDGGVDMLMNGGGALGKRGSTLQPLFPSWVHPIGIFTPGGGSSGREAADGV